MHLSTYLLVHFLSFGSGAVHFLQCYNLCFFHIKAKPDVKTEVVMTTVTFHSDAAHSIDFGGQYPEHLP